ncbi:hypothetical protein KXD40_008303 [Peronospora effusa]|nr:hypothetical protein KXD40_008303 [Peronospora effusa]
MVREITKSSMGPGDTLPLIPPTMFSSNKIFAVCIAVVVLSSGVHAEKEVAETFGLYHNHGLGVGVVGGVGGGVGGGIGVGIGVGGGFGGGVGVGVKAVPPTMFSSNKIFAVCIAVVVLSSGVHAEKEVAETFGLYHNHGLGVGVVGGVGGGVGGGIGVGIGVGGGFGGGVGVGVKAVPPTMFSSNKIFAVCIAVVVLSSGVHAEKEVAETFGLYHNHGLGVGVVGGVGGGVGGGIGVGIGVGGGFGGGVGVGVKAVPPTMFSSNKIFAVCIAVVVLSSGVHAEKEVAETFGLYHNHGLGVGVVGGVGGGVGGGIGVGGGVGGGVKAGVGYGAPTYVGGVYGAPNYVGYGYPAGTSTGGAAAASASATAIPPTMFSSNKIFAVCIAVVVLSSGVHAEKEVAETFGLYHNHGLGVGVVGGVGGGVGGGIGVGIGVGGGFGGGVGVGVKAVPPAMFSSNEIFAVCIAVVVLSSGVHAEKEVAETFGLYHNHGLGVGVVGGVGGGVGGGIGVGGGVGGGIGVGGGVGGGIGVGGGFGGGVGVGVKAGVGYVPPTMFSSNKIFAVCIAVVVLSSGVHAEKEVAETFGLYHNHGLGVGVVGGVGGGVGGGIGVGIGVGGGFGGGVGVGVKAVPPTMFSSNKIFAVCIAVVVLSSGVHAEKEVAETFGLYHNHGLGVGVVGGVGGGVGGGIGVGIGVGGGFGGGVGVGVKAVPPTMFSSNKIFAVCIAVVVLSSGVHAEKEVAETFGLYHNHGLGVGVVGGVGGGVGGGIGVGIGVGGGFGGGVGVGVKAVPPTMFSSNKIFAVCIAVVVLSSGVHAEKEVAETFGLYHNHGLGVGVVGGVGGGVGGGIGVGIGVGGGFGGGVGVGVKAVPPTMFSSNKIFAVCIAVVVLSSGVHAEKEVAETFGLYHNHGLGVGVVGGVGGGVGGGIGVGIGVGGGFGGGVGVGVKAVPPTMFSSNKIFAVCIAVVVLSSGVHAEKEVAETFGLYHNHGLGVGVVGGVGGGVGGGIGVGIVPPTMFSSNKIFAVCIAVVVLSSGVHAEKEVAETFGLYHNHGLGVGVVGGVGGGVGGGIGVGIGVGGGFGGGVGVGVKAGIFAVCIAVVVLSSGVHAEKEVAETFGLYHNHGLGVGVVGGVGGGVGGGIGVGGGFGGGVGVGVKAGVGYGAPTYVGGVYGAPNYVGYGYPAGTSNKIFAVCIAVVVLSSGVHAEKEVAETFGLYHNHGLGVGVVGGVGGGVGGGIGVGGGFGGGVGVGVKAGVGYGAPTYVGGVYGAPNYVGYGYPAVPPTMFSSNKIFAVCIAVVVLSSGVHAEKEVAETFGLYHNHGLGVGVVGGVGGGVGGGIGVVPPTMFSSNKIFAVCIAVVVLSSGVHAEKEVAETFGLYHNHGLGVGVVGGVGGGVGGGIGVVPPTMFSSNKIFAVCIAVVVLSSGVHAEKEVAETFGLYHNHGLGVGVVGGVGGGVGGGIGVVPPTMFSSNKIFAVCIAVVVLSSGVHAEKEVAETFGLYHNHGLGVGVVGGVGGGVGGGIGVVPPTMFSSNKIFAVCIAVVVLSSGVHAEKEVAETFGLYHNHGLGVGVVGGVGGGVGGGIGVVPPTMFSSNKIFAVCIAVVVLSSGVHAEKEVAETFGLYHNHGLGVGVVGGVGGGVGGGIGVGIGVGGGFGGGVGVGVKAGIFAVCIAVVVLSSGVHAEKEVAETFGLYHNHGLGVGVVGGVGGGVGGGIGVGGGFGGGVGVGVKAGVGYGAPTYVGGVYGAPNYVGYGYPAGTSTGGAAAASASATASASANAGAGNGATPTSNLCRFLSDPSLQIVPPTMFSSNKIFAVCIAVVVLSSGVHAEKEVAETFGLYHNHGLGVGVVGGVGGGVGGGIGVGIGVGGGFGGGVGIFAVCIAVVVLSSGVHAEKEVAETFGLYHNHGLGVGVVGGVGGGVGGGIGVGGGFGGGVGVGVKAGVGYGAPTYVGGVYGAPNYVGYGYPAVPPTMFSSNKIFAVCIAVVVLSSGVHAEKEVAETFGLYHNHGLGVGVVGGVGGGVGGGIGVVPPTMFSSNKIFAVCIAVVVLSSGVHAEKEVAETFGLYHNHGLGVGVVGGVGGGVGGGIGVGIGVGGGFGGGVGVGVKAGVGYVPPTMFSSNKIFAVCIAVVVLSSGVHAEKEVAETLELDVKRSVGVGGGVGGSVVPSTMFSSNKIFAVCIAVVVLSSGVHAEKEVAETFGLYHNHGLGVGVGGGVGVGVGVGVGGRVGGVVGGGVVGVVGGGVVGVVGGGVGGVVGGGVGGGVGVGVNGGVGYGAPSNVGYGYPAGTSTGGTAVASTGGAAAASASATAIPSTMFSSNKIFAVCIAVVVLSSGVHAEKEVAETFGLYHNHGLGVGVGGGVGVGVGVGVGGRVGGVVGVPSTMFSSNKIFAVCIAVVVLSSGVHAEKEVAETFGLYHNHGLGVGVGGGVGVGVGVGVGGRVGGVVGVGVNGGVGYGAPSNVGYGYPAGTSTGGTAVASTGGAAAASASATAIPSTMFSSNKIFAVCIAVVVLSSGVHAEKEVAETFGLYHNHGLGVGVGGGVGVGVGVGVGGRVGGVVGGGVVGVVGGGVVGVVGGGVGVPSTMFSSNKIFAVCIAVVVLSSGVHAEKEVAETFGLYHNHGLGVGVGGGVGVGVGVGVGGRVGGVVGGGVVGVVGGGVVGVVGGGVGGVVGGGVGGGVGVGVNGGVGYGAPSNVGYGYPAGTSTGGTAVASTGGAAAASASATASASANAGAGIGATYRKLRSAA